MHERGCSVPAHSNIVSFDEVKRSSRVPSLVHGFPDSVRRARVDIVDEDSVDPTDSADGRTPRASRRHQREKKRAARLFERQFGSDSSHDEPGAAAPRAAVYEGKMGRRARRASHMQSAATALPAFARLRAANLAGRFELPRGPFAAAASIVVTVFMAAFLYAPAQSYYQTMRENQRLEMEYAALQTRNAAIEAQNWALSTAAGVETAAHEEFGWVKKGEQTAHVSGLSSESSSSGSLTTYQREVKSSDIPLPTTWYSPLLDTVFGVS